MQRVSRERLAAWAVACLSKVGVPPEEAQLVAESLVQTSVWGIDSHGVLRLTHYLRRMTIGSVKAASTPVVMRTGPVTAQVHGEDGLGIVHATLAMESAIDTTVLGAAPAATTTYSYVYVQPNINFDRHAAMTQLREQRRAMHDKHVGSEKAAATFNVPSRAGEASTMTGGAPNMVTDNNSFVVGSRHIPHSSLTVNQPYYVLSY
jgi:hypothetical protein